MHEEKERPRPHGDALEHDNPAQAQSDAAPDASGGIGREETDRDRGRGSTANGIPASDEDAGAQRREQYRQGSRLVSETD